MSQTTTSGLFKCGPDQMLPFPYRITSKLQLDKSLCNELHQTKLNCTASTIRCMVQLNAHSFHFIQDLLAFHFLELKKQQMNNLQFAEYRILYTVILASVLTANLGKYNLYEEFTMRRIKKYANIIENRQPHLDEFASQIVTALASCKTTYGSIQITNPINFGEHLIFKNLCRINDDTMNKLMMKRPKHQWFRQYIGRNYFEQYIPMLVNEPYDQNVLCKLATNFFNNVLRSSLHTVVRRNSSLPLRFYHGIYRVRTHIMRSEQWIAQFPTLLAAATYYANELEFIDYNDALGNLVSASHQEDIFIAALVMIYNNGHGNTQIKNVPAIAELCQILNVAPLDVTKEQVAELIEDVILYFQETYEVQLKAAFSTHVPVLRNVGSLALLINRPDSDSKQLTTKYIVSNIDVHLGQIMNMAENQYQWNKFNYENESYEDSFVEDFVNSRMNNK